MTAPGPGVGEALAAYVDAPTPDTLAAVRRIVRAAPGHRRDLVPAELLQPLVRDADWAGVLDAGRALMPGALLSPSVHLVLAEAHHRLGDPAASARETTLARAAVAGILATGDGGPDAPWTVLRLSDEYDVLRALGTSSTGQQLLTRDGRSLDRHDGADGSTYHFDVTGLL